MTSRQRLLTAFANQQPDHVPAAPDLYEMVPVRLSGRPSWEMLLYQDPPVWKGRMDSCAYYGIDAFIPIGVPMALPENTAVVYRDDEKVIARDFSIDAEGRRHWSQFAVVFARNEPSAWVKATTIGLPNEHEHFELLRINYTKVGQAYFDEARAYVGERGVIAPMIWVPAIGMWPEETVEYCEYPEVVEERMRRSGETIMELAATILSWKPDMLLIGNSGMMIFNPPPVFRRLSLEWLQKLTRLAKDHGVLTHIHCCGPERALVEMAANESDLTSIEPLEPPPMGDCDLKEIKEKFGKKLAFKGNLHTTSIMLMGTPREVENACKRAIDDAGAGGGFILSTGDQTPRDVPDETIHIMRHVAETYGRY